jgi:group II intron reverse transcriptase/maturase
MDSFAERNTTESEKGRTEATSMDVTQSVEEKTTYDDLIPFVIADDNIDMALKVVVGNRGAPGVDGMSVFGLEQWLNTNRQELKDTIASGNYIPTPVRRVEIPKPNGGTRNLGIPTVKDRLVQQMVAQVLGPIYDPTFSDASYGYRPGRSAQDAVMKVQEYYDQGYTQAVGIDLAKFFDSLNQQFLMNIIRIRIKDQVLIRLIKRFLRAGVVLPDGVVVSTTEGSSQGSPLSPLLSNIYLDLLDKELESRGLKHLRYADDSLIMLKSPRACQRVCESVTRYLEEELKLKVNRDKTEIGSPKKLKFLGFVLTRRDKGAGIRPHQSAIAKFKKNVIAITKRNRGISFDRMLVELNQYLRGWIGYYGLSTSDDLMRRLAGWVRRRLRQYLFKQWKKTYTRFKSLRRLCPPYLRLADEDAVAMLWVASCWKTAKMDSYWGASDTRPMTEGLDKRTLMNMGFMDFEGVWLHVRERCTNRRVPNGPHGGVRGQPT